MTRLPEGAIDAAVHHHWVDQAQLTAYMPRAWRDYMAGPEKALRLTTDAKITQLIPASPYADPGGEYADGTTPAGGVPGSDPETLAAQVLTEGVERAVLSFQRGAQIPALVNHYLGLQAIRAANDWTIDRWLTADHPGLHALVLVPNQLPQYAAREIRRVGRHPRMAGVLMGANGIGKPFGHPLYHPIYAAAADLDLPVVIGAGGDLSPDTISHPTAGGLPLSHGEATALAASSTMTHMTSLIAEGVFEKYPTLKVLASGTGALWLSSLVWRFDIEWKGLRRETPWVKRLPSEYVHEHIRVTTHPMPQSVAPERVARLLAALDGMDDILCFASGYPRRDLCAAARTAELMPVDWAQKVFRDNAAALFRWEAPSAVPARARPARTLGVGATPA